MTEQTGIKVKFTAFLNNEGDGSTGLVLIKNELVEKIDFDKIDERLSSDIVEIELLIGSNGEVLEGLTITDEDDLEEFTQENYNRYGE